MSDLTINWQRLNDELCTLATFTEPPSQNAVIAEGDTAVTRLVFTDHDRDARAYLISHAEAAGLSVRTDAIGNTFFRWEGSKPELAAVATGSHIDAIPNAGMYDGTVGVLGGLEAIRALQESGFTPERSIELILFTSEEPTRFGIGCLGSRLMAGTLPVEEAAALKDKAGITVDEARKDAGFTGSLESVRLEPGHYAGFVELHIEQMPELEKLEQAQGGKPMLGVVTAIAAPSSATITVQGEGGHAGALLMPYRHDAFAAAVEIISAVESAALRTGSIDTVATVGKCDVFPGASNSVPSRVEFSLDVRDINLERRDSVLDDIRAACAATAEKRGVTIVTKIINADAPATSAPAIVDAITEVCRQNGVPAKEMVSRAFHDSLFMAKVAPVAMIFTSCREGVSHRPDEFATPEAITAGTRALAGTLATLSHA